MRIAVFQGPFASAGVAANLERLGKLAHECRGAGCRPARVPRDVPHRLRHRPRGGAPAGRAGRRAVGRPGRRDRPRGRRGPALRLSRSCGEDGRVYNAALLLDRDGRRLANHRKTHLYGALDRDAFAAGAGPPTVAELDGRQARHPDLLRRRVSRRTSGCWRIAGRRAGRRADGQHGALRLRRRRAGARPAPTRTICSSPTPTAAAARASLEYVGRSCVVGPDGSDLARAGAGEELIVADLDLARLRDRAAAQPLPRRPPARALCRARGTWDTPMTASHAPAVGASADRRPVTYFGPDFPFAYDDWLAHPAGPGRAAGRAARHRGRDRRRRVPPAWSPPTS